ncbi:hypothetical protein A33M_2005 [Rhodovulum sp. PH10]|nr:hypothetical protein A33M_2005 [Rhodovulum sp. PH10]
MSGGVEVHGVLAGFGGGGGETSLLARRRAGATPSGAPPSGKTPSARRTPSGALAPLAAASAQPQIARTKGRSGQVLLRLDAVASIDYGPPAAGTGSLRAPGETSCT